MIRIEAPLNPVPFCRPAQNGKRRFKNARYTEFKDELRFFALNAMGKREPLKGAVRIRVQFYRRKPKKLTSRMWGDVDNHLKSVLDALNGICYEDDSQVVEVTGRKCHGEPRVLIELEELKC